MEDGRREIWILNFAVSIASKNKNIEGKRGRREQGEEFRIRENRPSRVRPRPRDKSRTYQNRSLLVNLKASDNHTACNDFYQDFLGSTIHAVRMYVIRM